MNAQTQPTHRILVAIATLLPINVLAHTGPGAHDGFFQGLVHPLTGFDHLLALLAVGLWAGQLSARNAHRALSAFVAALLTGSLVALAGVSLPMVEPGIALSVTLFGILVVAGNRVPAHHGAGLISVFALLHGHAHGTELPFSSTSCFYMSGILVSSLTLLLCTYALARVILKRGPILLPVSGLTIAAVGTWIFASL